MFNSTIISCILLLLLCFTVYSGSFGHEFLRNWDDTTYVTQNPAIREITLHNIVTLSTSAYAGNIAPLQMVSYMLDHALWGLDPAGFKGTNILLQALCGCVLFRILFTSAGIPVLPSLFAAALFLVHPVQVEPVVWISQRKTLLATLFFLLAYLLYDRSIEKKERHSFFLSIIAFAFSLLSKSSGVGFPLLLLARNHCAGVALRTSLQRIAPFMAMAGAAAALTVHVQSSPDSAGGVIDWHGGGFFSNARLALSLPAAYIRLLLWPTGLSAHYPEQIPGFFSFPFMAGTLLSLSFLAACLMLLKRKNRLSLPLVAMGLGFLPVMQIIPILPTMNDRYWHLPLAGVAVLTGIALQKISLHNSAKLLTVSILIVLLSVLSVKRTAAWSDSITLWQSAVKIYPDDPRILLIMGDSWRAYGDYAAAGDFFERSIATGQTCEALHKAAAARMAERVYDRARGHLAKMLDVCDRESKRDALLLLAESWQAEGKPHEAAAAYETYLKAAPNSFTGHNALGNIYLALKRYDAAQEHLLRAAALSPADAALRTMFPLTQLREIRLRSGRTNEAAVLEETLHSLRGHVR
jgi:tetratricopeptide (TPR) repeat protein